MKEHHEGFENPRKEKMCRYFRNGYPYNSLEDNCRIQNEAFLYLIKILLFLVHLRLCRTRHKQTTGTVQSKARILARE